ncbi:MAG: hypothetical protein K8R69_11570 [Deltaproteobacteria bacterium]|nr:hypothetical protein [Deltaproteobacteria bacterium]
MLPVILGVAAAAIFLSGCSRSEESPSPPSAPPPDLPPPASAPRLRPLGSASGGRWLVPTLIPSRLAGPLSFSAPQCSPEAARPERFVIQDARQEYCRLH